MQGEDDMENLADQEVDLDYKDDADDDDAVSDDGDVEPEAGPRTFAKESSLTTSSSAQLDATRLYLNEIGASPLLTASSPFWARREK